MSSNLSDIIINYDDDGVIDKIVYQLKSSGILKMIITLESVMASTYENLLKRVQNNPENQNQGSGRDNLIKTNLN